jgi:hypothetical protein
MKRLLFSMIVLFTISLLGGGCATVKPYQKMYLNDEDMKLSNTKLEYYEDNYQTYREAASGANGGKVGGGCGCN